MSDDLTVAGAALLKGLAEDMQLNAADRAGLSGYVARVEQESAARERDRIADAIGRGEWDAIFEKVVSKAITEAAARALSVERVAEALDAVNAANVRIIDSHDYAAALVAHLRGHR